MKMNNEHSDVQFVFCEVGKMFPVTYFASNGSLLFAIKNEIYKKSYRKLCIYEMMRKRLTLSLAQSRKKQILSEIGKLKSKNIVR